MVWLEDTSGEPPRFRDVTDGTSNTIAVLGVDSVAAVEWTKPAADWEYDPLDPKHDLGNALSGLIAFVNVDGSTAWCLQTLARKISRR